MTMAVIIRQGVLDAIEKLDGLHAISINEKHERSKKAGSIGAIRTGIAIGCDHAFAQ